MGFIKILKRELRYIILQIKCLPKATIIRSRKVAFGAKIGNKVLIGKNVFVSHNSIIEDFTYINENSSIENSRIGKFCSIASGVNIGPADHDYTLLTTHPFWKKKFYGFIDFDFVENKLELLKKESTIGDDVWIGLNVTILSGLNIGDGAVIGAGSVVTKNIPPYEIWAGIPAKKIKNRFEDEQVKKLTAIRWTRRPKDWIIQNILPHLNDIESIVDLDV